MSDQDDDKKPKVDDEDDWFGLKKNGGSWMAIIAHLFEALAEMFLGKDNFLSRALHTAERVNEAIEHPGQAISRGASSLGHSIAQSARDAGHSIAQGAHNLYDRAGSAIRSGWNGVLDLIGQHESGGNYNLAYGGKRVDFTNMTINEVQQWQKNYVNAGSPSSAAGKYQIIQKTMAGLITQMGLTGNEKFDQAMQDRMAMQLLENRGISRFAAGKMSTDQILNAISKEWASIQGANGAGAYDHDGINHAARGTGTRMAAALESARSGQGTSATSVATTVAPTPVVVAAAAAPAMKAAATPTLPAPIVATVNQATSDKSWAEQAVAKITAMLSSPAPTTVASADSVSRTTVFDSNGNKMTVNTYGGATPAPTAAAAPVPTVLAANTPQRNAPVLTPSAT